MISHPRQVACFFRHKQFLAVELHESIVKISTFEVESNRYAEVQMKELSFEFKTIFSNLQQLYNFIISNPKSIISLQNNKIQIVVKVDWWKMLLCLELTVVELSKSQSTRMNILRVKELLDMKIKEKERIKNHFQKQMAKSIKSMEMQDALLVESQEAKRESRQKFDKLAGQRQHLLKLLQEKQTEHLQIKEREGRVIDLL